MSKRIDKVPIKCKFCGREFVPRDKRTIACQDKECRNKYNQYKYSISRKECVCSVCGKTYYATRKQSKDKCPDCVRPKHRNYKQYEQKIVCRQCGKVLGTRIKNLRRSPLYESKEITCDECKKKIYSDISHRMKLNNPSYFGTILTDAEYAEKKRIEAEEELYRNEHKEERKMEVRKAASERMKENNPMYNSASVKKMRETVKRKLETGELVHKKGSERANWKGGSSRSIKNYIRVALKPWRKEMLRRSNYTCERCGKVGGILHIHHNESFSDIVETIASELGIDIYTIKFRSDEYNLLEQRVIDYHNNNDIGIVLCADCHDAVDVHFHKESLRKKETE